MAATSIGRPDAARDLGAVRAQELHHAGADRAEADQPDPDGPRRRPPGVSPACARRVRLAEASRRAPCGCRGSPAACGARSR